MHRVRLILMVAAAVVGLATACKKDDATCSDTAVSCGRSIGTCCSSTACYYTYNGQRYNCNGTDCSSAASQVVRAACGMTPNPSLSSKDVTSLMAASRILGEGACPTSLP